MFCSLSQISTGSAAESSFESVPLGYLSGVVTAKKPMGVQINNLDYAVLINAVVIDQKGQNRSLGSLMPGHQVHFHIKQDDAKKNDKVIDKLIMFRPQ
jgi:hypothetical protein